MTSFEKDPFYLRYILAIILMNVPLTLLLNDVDTSEYSICASARSTTYRSFIFLQYWSLWKTRTRVSGIRVLTWAVTICEQLELSKRQLDSQREYVWR